jgi:hypothetical protein
MKNLIKQFTTLISRGVFRSALAALAVTAALSLSPKVHAYEYDRATGTYTFTGKITTSADFNFTDGMTWRNTTFHRTLPVTVCLMPSQNRALIYTPILTSSPSSCYLGTLIDTARGWQSNGVNSWVLSSASKIVPFGSQTTFDSFYNAIQLPRQGSQFNASVWNLNTSPNPTNINGTRATPSSCFMVDGGGLKGATLRLSAANGVLTIFVQGKTSQNLGNYSFSMTATVK